MTKTEMLFIRACKSANPETRLYSVYKRFYEESYELYKQNIVGILIEIVDKYCPMTMAEYYQRRDSYNLCLDLCNEKQELWEIELYVLKQQIAEMTTPQLKDLKFIFPRKYRNYFPYCQAVYVEKEIQKGYRIKLVTSKDNYYTSYKIYEDKSDAQKLVNSLNKNFTELFYK